MCGIVGYTGHRPCRQLLLDGLERLEYRGYDSAGLALLADGRVERVRTVGNLARLREAITALAPGGVATEEAEPVTGIGHTRWATHGRVTAENAHPHTDSAERVHVVVNGIVENHAELRDRLAGEGASFASDTDAEVVAHAIAHRYVGDLVAAVRSALCELSGHFAFVALAADEPGLLVAARRECPLVVGVGKGERFVASAIPAFLRATRSIQLVEDGEVVALTPEGAEFSTARGTRRTRPVTRVDWDDDAAEKRGFESFMLKEIHEQPVAVAATLEGASHATAPDDDELRALRRIGMVACGTSYHAALAGRLAIEAWTGVPVDVEVASEARHRSPLLDPPGLVVGVTQSGETADTLAVMRLARERGGRVLALTNAPGSQATREADSTLLTRAGVEVGVAATKTFVAQLAALYAFGLRLARARGTLPPARLTALAAELTRLPHVLAGALVAAREPAARIAERFADAGFFLYLGRHAGLPVALEGALKLKEISYVPTDAYAAGEMKHGPIALLSEGTPVVCVATDSPVLAKVLSNMSEVRARGAAVVAIATEGRKEVAEHAEEVVYVPPTDPLLQPIAAVVPLQLIAYGVARARGLDVDRPRNLAKTVTVE